MAKSTAETLIEQSKAMIAQTKAEGSKAYTGSKYDIGRATAPTNVSQVNTVKETAIPKDKPTDGNVTNALAGMTGVSEYAKGRMQDLDTFTKERLKAEENRKTESKSIFEKFLGKDGENVTSPWEARDTAWEDTGMDVKDYFRTQEAGIKEVEALSTDYEKTKAERDDRIARIEDNQLGALEAGVDQRVLQTEKFYNTRLNTKSAEINAKAATLQAQQGNFAEAQKYVNQAVQDATADTKFRYDMFKTFYDMNEDTFDNVESIYKDAYTESMAVAENEHKLQVEEKTQIAEWLIKYPNAGISLNDSLETAARKASSVSGKGTVDTDSMSRAKMVLNGQAALTDYTTAEQAKIRDAIWSMNVTDAGYVGQQPMSYAPGALDREFNQRRMSVAGPGAGVASEPVGELTPAEMSKAYNYVLLNGTAENLERFFVDRKAQAEALRQAEM
jgi:hypothetical protein